MDSALPLILLWVTNAIVTTPVQGYLEQLPQFLLFIYYDFLVPVHEHLLNFYRSADLRKLGTIGLNHTIVKLFKFSSKDVITFLYKGSKNKNSNILISTDLKITTVFCM